MAEAVMKNIFAYLSVSVPSDKTKQFLQACGRNQVWYKNTQHSHHIHSEQLQFKQMLTIRLETCAAAVGMVVCACHTVETSEAGLAGCQGKPGGTLRTAGWAAGPVTSLGSWRLTSLERGLMEGGWWQLETIHPPWELGVHHWGGRHLKHRRITGDGLGGQVSKTPWGAGPLLLDVVHVEITLMFSSIRTVCALKVHLACVVPGLLPLWALPVGLMNLENGRSGGLAWKGNIGKPLKGPGIQLLLELGGVTWPTCLITLSPFTDPGSILLDGGRGIPVLLSLLSHTLEKFHLASQDRHFDRDIPVNLISTLLHATLIKHLIITVITLIVCLHLFHTAYNVLKVWFSSPPLPAHTHTGTSCAHPIKVCIRQSFGTQEKNVAFAFHVMIPDEIVNTDLSRPRDPNLTSAILVGNATLLSNPTAMQARIRPSTIHRGYLMCSDSGVILYVSDVTGHSKLLVSQRPHSEFGMVKKYFCSTSILGRFQTSNLQQVESSPTHCTARFGREREIFSSGLSLYIHLWLFLAKSQIDIHFPSGMLLILGAVTIHTPVAIQLYTFPKYCVAKSRCCHQGASPGDTETTQPVTTACSERGAIPSIKLVSNLDKPLLKTQKNSPEEAMCCQLSPWKLKDCLTVVTKQTHLLQKPRQIFTSTSLCLNI
ncbi:hypothetical protein MAR_010270 [Mya arenaria]|uniref:Uncharacterized protein n=1 Tax=Mya arenaria TaxID=6604 RepID=A0ABY7E140_MYAAR|nr:hypothetical protein MAR_010270 [Mya arenaria]